jgi:hypothetical protein
MARRSFGQSLRKATSGGAVVGDASELGLMSSLGTSDGFSFGDKGASQARLALAEFRSWVYVCVNAIAGRLSSQPMVACLVSDDQKSKTGKRNSRLDVTRKRKVPESIRAKLPTAFSMEILTSGDIVRTLEQPNPVQSRSQFLYFSAASLLLCGECYWVAGLATPDESDQTSDDGPRVEYWAIPRTWIKPLHEGRLFSGYELRTSPNAEPILLSSSQVARTYFPDPSDIRACRSPLQAVATSVRVDDRLQASQEQAFDRGLDPNLIVTVGRLRDEDGKLGDRRPRLTGSQRRQLIRAVQEVWDSTVNEGYPAIVDGFIESVHKLSNTPSEMDWTESGDVIKRRIFQAFRVNPIIVGEIVGANRAQVVEAEKHFCANAVNPIASALSDSADRLSRSFFEGGSSTRLTVYVEQAEPTDPDLDTRRWGDARKLGDVTRDEYRAELLGLPPLEDDNATRNTLLSTVGGITGTVQVVTAVGQGMVRPEQAQAMLELFLEIPPDVAGRIAGVGQAPIPALTPPNPPGGPVPSPAPPKPADPVDDNEEPPLAEDAPPQPDESQEASYVARYDVVPLAPTQSMQDEAAVGLGLLGERTVQVSSGLLSVARRIAGGERLRAIEWRWLRSYLARCGNAGRNEPGWNRDEASWPSLPALLWTCCGGDAAFVRSSYVCACLDTADRREAKREKFAGATTTITRADVKALNASQLNALIGGAADQIGGTFQG